MTTPIALPLFDVMRLSADNGPAGSADSEQFSVIAAEFVGATLADYRHIRKLDEIPSGQPLVFDRQVAILIRRMYEEWATQAEGLLMRLRTMKSGANANPIVADVSELRDAVLRTRAMLSVSLEEIEEGIAECERGETVTLEEVRRELRAASGR